MLPAMNADSYDYSYREQKSIQFIASEELSRKKLYRSIAVAAMHIRHTVPRKLTRNMVNCYYKLYSNTDIFLNN